MTRKLIATALSLLATTLIFGCASTPTNEAPAAAAVPVAPAAAEAEAPAEAAAAETTADATAEAAAEPKVVSNTAQAKKYVSEEEAKRAYRECMRKMRRITGSRIPRNACQGSAGMYGNAFNQRQEGSGQVSGGGLPGE